MIFAPFGVGYANGSFTVNGAPPKTTDTYGNGGSASVHYVLSQMATEIIFVLILGSIASRGGNSEKLALAIMGAVALLWLLNFVQQGGKL